ncbi:MAG: hypothetical protein CME68_08580 [Halobacteriovoraceae bacterium]|nr:hypothetical protein [Halobacteriovoraceae bacterium]
MNRVFFIYLTSIMLLVSAKKVGPKTSKTWYKEVSKLEEILISSSNPIRERFKKKVHFDLLIAYVTGNKKSLPTKLKKSHKTLSITHLFTPSGLHFSSLYFFFIPLFSYLKKRSPPSYLFAHTTLCATPFLLTGFNSIKRICIFHTLKVVKSFLDKEKLKQIDNFYLILFTFLIDAIRGSFFESPLSFCYSFIFLGLLFCYDDFNPQRIFFYFFGAQVILAFFSLDLFSIFGLFFGFLLTYLFSFLFPFWLPIFFIPMKIQSILGITFLIEKSISLFVKSILFLNDIVFEFNFFFSSLPLILSVLLCSYKLQTKIKLYLFTTLILLHSNPLLNFPISTFQKPLYPVNYKNLKKNKIDSVYFNRGRVIIIFKNGKRCVHELRPQGISEKCRYL